MSHSAITPYIVQRDGETYWTIAEKCLKESVSQPTSEEILLMARWLRTINGPDHCLRPGQRVFFGRPHEGVAD